jgi:hypothetical protein
LELWDRWVHMDGKRRRLKDVQIDSFTEQLEDKGGHFYEAICLSSSLFCLLVGLSLFVRPLGLLTPSPAKGIPIMPHRRLSVSEFVRPYCIYLVGILYKVLSCSRLWVLQIFTETTSPNFHFFILCRQRTHEYTHLLVVICCWTIMKYSQQGIALSTKQ